MQNRHVPIQFRHFASRREAHYSVQETLMVNNTKW
jgi:hypothetical protein